MMGPVAKSNVDETLDVATRFLGATERKRYAFVKRGTRGTLIVKRGVMTIMGPRIG